METLARNYEFLSTEIFSRIRSGENLSDSYTFLPTEILSHSMDSENLQICVPLQKFSVALGMATTYEFIGLCPSEILTIISDGENLVISTLSPHPPPTPQQRSSVVSGMERTYEFQSQSHQRCRLESYKCLPTEILSRIRDGENPPLRPAVPGDRAGGQKVGSEVPDKVVMLMQRCWSDSPADRPLFPAIKASVAALNKGRLVHL